MMERWLGNAILATVLTVVTGALLYVFNLAAMPHDRVLAIAGAREPDYAALEQRVTAASLEADIAALTATPSRFSGSPGAADARAYLTESLAEVGFTVSTQPFPLAVPVTRHASLRTPDGVPVPDCSVAPMLPNRFRTSTTPPGGLTGTVYRAELGLAREFEGVDLAGNFVLLPLGVPWRTVAGMGAAAVLYYDDGRLSGSANWEHHVDASMNVPRVLFEGDPAAVEGRTVVLRVEQDFEAVEARNVIAVRAVPDADEALVLTAHYDAYSYVPDRAPGVGQACGPAALLAIARQVAHEADGLRRSVYVVATEGHGQGAFGIREFARCLGRAGRGAATVARAVAAHEQALEVDALAVEAVRIARDPAYWAARGADAEAAYWASRAPALRAAFEARLIEALDEELMASMEAVTQAKIAWTREGMPVKGPDGSPAATFLRYSAAKERQQRAQAVLRTPPGEAKQTWAEHFTTHAIPARTVAMTEQHRDAVARRVARRASRRALAEQLARYTRVMTLHVDLSARSPNLALLTGVATLASKGRPGDKEVESQVHAAAVALDALGDPVHVRNEQGDRRVRNLVRERDEADLAFVANAGSRGYFHTAPFLWAGHPAFAFSSPRDSRQWFGTPFDYLDRSFPLPGDTVDADDEEAVRAARFEPLTRCTRLVAGAVARLALGHGRMVATGVAPTLHDIRGQAVSRIGEDLTPDHIMPGALLRVEPKDGSAVLPKVPGMGRDVMLMAGRDGRFEMPHVWREFVTASRWASEVSIDAALLDPVDGSVMWTLSEDDSGPGQPYATLAVDIAQYDKSQARPVLFRCAAVQVVPMQDPATLRDYAAFGVLERKGLAAPVKMKIEKAGNTYVCFVPPDTRMYFTFKKGSYHNPNLTAVRAFALGATGPVDGSGGDPDAELQGEGYFAADDTRITNIEIDAAVSMAQVNSRRLRVQERYDMADQMMLHYNRRACDLADEARTRAAEGDMVSAKHLARESVAYSTNIHPVIRKNASDAIVGILFYLMLAIPFAIFAEKLLIGHPDIRVQIAWQGLIFVGFFMALRAVHPAYELVRSSYMILLGFITFALALFVGVFVTGRFSTNVGELQQRMQKRAEVADVSRAGAASSAFILGLGHMRKRMVRTSLTVGTLVLTVFVMLSFTSMTTDVVDEQFAVGNAPYTGLFVRSRSVEDVHATLGPLRELYGREHIVAPRMWMGTFEYKPGEATERAAYTLTHEHDGRTSTATAYAMLGLAPAEVEVTGLRDAFIALRDWFEDENAFVCYLPQAIADALHITADEVRAGTAEIQYGDRVYTVNGIFDSHRMDGVLDLDGESLMPVDVLGLMEPGRSGGEGGDATDVPSHTPRLPSQDVVIVPFGALPARSLTASVAVAFQGLEYADARGLITSHLERSGEPAYYGLDNVAFYGGKLRRRSVGGLLDLILPIIIAAMTVLNTMRGSVYERRDEIYVFNSVGLSPTHIRALFLAEASVYAVVGAVGGYLLAQAVGAGVDAAGIASGLSMNYSSLASVVVSVVIMLVVFVSAIFPARMASRLAAPADTMTRQRHTSEGDVMAIDLPFMFSRRDRVAVIPYFMDWFDNFGEGSSGEFVCEPPVCGVIEGEGGVAVPCVSTTCWLKPYDLGVSQRVDVVVRHVAETGDNVATVTMTRLSGDVESWERCCHAFIGLLRKRFLTWRGVTNEDREQLLTRGRGMLQESLAGAPVQA